MDIATLPRHYRVSEIANALGTNQQKIIQWIHRGELRATNIADKIGARARWVVAPEDLETFLRSRQPSPPAPKVARRKKTEGVTEYY